MTQDEMKRQIEAAIVCADQLVFTYFKDNNDIETRFVTPISMELRAGAVPPASGPVPLDDLMVLCSQHLPEDGYRKFSMGRMKSIARVIARATPQ